jgi:preprotein translocase subunit YajC
MGTVTKIAQNSITVETSAKATVEVKIVPETKFTKNGASAYIKDLQIGDRVVIHAKKVKDQLVAHTVQIGAAKSGGNTH